MPAPPPPLELELLCQKLDADYGPYIRAVGNGEKDRRSNFLSKAIAAFVLHEAAGASIEDAVAASIDGGLDHGIDSVWIAPDQTIWLVQSKYSSAGHGEPPLGDVSKFRDGVMDLLQGRWERFNQALIDRRAAIAKALDNDACKIRAVLAYSGTAMSDDRRDIFADLERAFNATNPGFVRCFAYGLATLHGLQLDGMSDAPIDAEIELYDFGHTTTPYRAFYGRMAAKRLAELWNEHGDHLVALNIRRFKGSTAVNDALSDTLRHEARHFFYYNNGVTFLCNSIHEQHPRDPHRQSGKFRVRGLSIINGAQTVGAIAREPVAGYIAEPAEVMATFVSLENAPEDFSHRVTQARNSQNSVDIEDFAALDERQSTWQQTLKSAGIQYVVKPGEDDPPPSATCFSAREVAPFLACRLTTADWVDFIVAAKASKKKLFGRPEFATNGDPLRDAYERIFADSLTARQMWRVVQIGRSVRDNFRGRANSEADPLDLPAESLPAREILKHGVWLALHVLLIRRPLHDGVTMQLTPDELVAISSELDVIARHLVEVTQSERWRKQARAVFESRTDCRTIKNRLMAELARYG